MACPKCGREHLTRTGSIACTGHRKSRLDPDSGERVFYPEAERPACRNSSMHGQTVCHAHGGRNPKAITAAAQRIAQQKAGQLMTTYGARVDVDPGEEMLDLICWTAGHVRWLRARVQEIEESTALVRVEDDDQEDGYRTEQQRKHGLVWGITKDKIGGDDSGTTYEAKPNIYLALYNSETDRLAKLCTEAIKIGLKEREVRLAERQGDLVMKILDGVLAELGHNPSDPAVAGTIERHLRSVG